jgi:hypothetical protein
MKKTGSQWGAFKYRKLFDFEKWRTQTQDSWLGFGGTWPSASLSISDQEIEYRILWMKFVFPKSKILSLSRFGLGIFGDGLRIAHLVDGYPKCFIFYPLSFSKLESALEGHSYKVSESAKDVQLESNETKYANTFGPLSIIAGILSLAAAVTAIVLAYQNR